MSNMQELSVDLLVPDPDQPRKYYDESAMAELTASIKSLGVLQPILARPWACATPEQTYKIVAGERRYRAAKAAGLATLPVIVKALNDEEALEIQITENLIRKDVHPVEEAVAFKSLSEKYSPAEIAARVGKSEGFVVKRIKLAELVPDGQDIYFRNLIDMKTAQMLCRLSPDEQQAVIDEACDRDKKNGKIGDVSQWRIANACSNAMQSLDKVPFKTSDAKLYPEAGACTKCPHNTANSPLLFDDMKGRMCTKPSCLNIKLMRAQQAKLQEIAADPNRIVVVDSTYLNSEDKLKVEAAREMGITILDKKLWEREYGAPDEEFKTYEEHLEDCYWEDDEPTPEELHEARQDYEAEKRGWEEDRKEYEQALASGAIVEAYNLLDGRSIPIRLKGAGTAMVQAQTGDAGDAAILAEIANMESREARAKEIDAEKVWKQILELLKDNGLTKEIFSTAALSETEMTAAFHAMADKIGYSEKKWLREQFGDFSTWEGVTEFGFNEMVRIFILATLPNAYGSHVQKGSKNYYAYQMLREHAGSRISIIEQEQQEKADKRQANVAKRIEALRAKLSENQEA